MSDLSQYVSIHLQVLFCLFSVRYFKAYKDGECFQDGIGEAQSKQGITIG